MLSQIYYLTFIINIFINLNFKKMISKKVNLKFKGSYADFYDQCLEKVANVERDAEHFLIYNVTPEGVLELKAKIQDLKSSGTDDEMLYEQVNQSIVKTEKTTHLRVGIRQLITLIETSLPENMAEQLIRFDVPYLSRLGTAELVNEAENIVRMAQKYGSELVTAGINATLVSNIATLATELRQIDLQHKEALVNRKIATKSRHEQANEIYSQIVKYCKIGRAIWMNTDKVLYDTYLLSNTMSSNPVETEEPDAEVPETENSGG